MKLKALPLQGEVSVRNVMYLLLLLVMASNVQAKDEVLKHAKSVKKGAHNMTQKLETATLAAGCFWGVEEILRAIPGVRETVVGYTGGKLDSPKYELVKTGSTGHAEAVEISFDPSKISFEELLGYFFRLHDPTQKDRQQNDIGTQYRSAIFYHNETQQKTAKRVKEKVDTSGKWKTPVVTEIVAYNKFFKAEDYHQDYLQKNPNGYTCHFLRD